MKNIKFDGCNVVYGKDQPEYNQLHAQKGMLNGAVGILNNYAERLIKRI